MAIDAATSTTAAPFRLAIVGYAERWRRYRNRPARPLPSSSTDAGSGVAATEAAAVTDAADVTAAETLPGPAPAAAAVTAADATADAETAGGSP